MASPQYSIVLSAQVNGAVGPVAVGDGLIRSASDPRYWVVATEANRGTRRSEAVALTAFGGTGVGTIELAMTGTPSSSVVNVGTVGGKQFVRMSSAGRLERVAAPTANDDICGYCEADGRVHLYFGLPAIETLLLLVDPLTGGIAVENGGTGLTELGAPLEVLRTNATGTAMEWAPAGGGGSGLQGWVNVKDHGAVGNGSADDSAAFAAAITAAGNGIVWIPAGTYRLASSLVIRRRVHLVGAGGFGTSDTAPSEVSTSVLALDAGRSIIVDSNTSSAGNGSAVGSVFEDIAIKQHASEGLGTHVVEVYARASWFRCTIYGDNGGGHGWAVLSGNHENTRNEWIDCHVTGTGGNGWHVLVGNSNIIGGSAISCVGAGVYIANVFGCGVFGTRLIDCNPSGVAFQLSGPPGSEDAQGEHIAVGCGVSGGNGQIRLGSSSQWIGGPSTAGLTTSSLGQYMSSGYWTPVKVRNQRTGITIYSFLGVASTAQIAFQWQSSDDANEFRLHYDETASAQRWPLRYMGNSTGALELTAQGHAEGAGNLLLPRGIVLGPAANRRIMTFGSAAPTGASTRTSGNWAIGDVVWNDRSVDTTVMCWVCTTAGNPGTWTAHNL